MIDLHQEKLHLILKMFQEYPDLLLLVNITQEERKKICIPMDCLAQYMHPHTKHDYLSLMHCEGKRKCARILTHYCFCIFNAICVDKNNTKAH